MSHTPAPWEARWPKYDALILDAAERVIASVSFNDHEDAECEANARLIAAAPVMYQELTLAADTFRDMSSVLRVIGKDMMSAAADIAERHIREQLAVIDAEGTK